MIKFKKRIVTFVLVAALTSMLTTTIAMADNEEMSFVRELSVLQNKEKCVDCTESVDMASSSFRCISHLWVVRTRQDNSRNPPATIQASGNDSRGCFFSGSIGNRRFTGHTINAGPHNNPIRLYEYSGSIPHIACNFM
jgi:hypothetical protein